MIQISLAAARVNANLKQDEVAKMLGITPRTLSQYEHGNWVIPATTLRKVAKIYGIPSDMIRLEVVEDGEYDEKILSDTTV